VPWELCFEFGAYPNRSFDVAQFRKRQRRLGQRNTCDKWARIMLLCVYFE